MRIDVLPVGCPPFDTSSWPHGDVAPLSTTPAELRRNLAARLADPEIGALLFWDYSLGDPEGVRIQELLETPADVWHAGLTVGTGGLPRAIDFVVPTWMFNKDPDLDLDATSWRVSLGACLVKADVLRRLDSIDAGFESLAGAGLELGYRCLKLGALVRHAPWLLPSTLPIDRAALDLPIGDELRFVNRAFGGFWTRWAAWRMVSNGYPRFTTVGCLRKVMREPAPSASGPYSPDLSRGRSKRPPSYTVSVLIPTIGRYPQLRTLLQQLRSQTVPPLEVIVVDQNQPRDRDDRLAEDFPDLPLGIIYQEQPGQCSSRNLGLQAARGELILLLDDDIEIEDDLVERHLDLLKLPGVDASCGIAEEVGMDALPESFSYVRASDVFPAGNTLVRRDALTASGFFDLAYDKGPRADLDLGMRLYLAGKLMLLNPAARVRHLRSSRGGLRRHEARVVTYAASRHSLVIRHTPAPTEIYLWLRYFNSRQVSEALTLRLAGTFRTQGNKFQRATRLLVGLALLPHTWIKTQRSKKQAHELARSYPKIDGWSETAQVPSVEVNPLDGVHEAGGSIPGG